MVTGDRVVLRPMTDGDWDILLQWNNGREVMNHADANPIEVSTVSDIGRRVLPDVGWTAPVGLSV